MTTTNQNRALMQRWYNDMWGKTDFDLIPEIAAPQYLRHDMTGANNLIPADAYRDLLKPMLGSIDVQAFTYYIACEGDFIGTLGRYMLPGDMQWDWVQVFRVEDGHLAETWLTGMGGTNSMAIPQPQHAWNGSEIPATSLPDSNNKNAVRTWLKSLIDHQDSSSSLADQVRVHDLLDADRTVSADQYHQEMRSLMSASSVSDFKIFMIEENDVIFAICSWLLDDNRQWDWIQAFQLRDARITRTWLPSIGGNDESLSMGPATRWAADALPDEATSISCSN